MLKILDIKKHNQTSFEDFGRLERYKNNLKHWIEYCKKNNIHQTKKIKLMEAELASSTKSVKQIYSGKRG